MIQRPITSYHSGWRKAKDSFLAGLPVLCFNGRPVSSHHLGSGPERIQTDQPEFLHRDSPQYPGCHVSENQRRNHSRRNRQWNHRHITYGGTGLRYRNPDRYYGWNLLIGKTQNLIFSCDPFSDRPPARHAVDRHRYHRLCLGCRSFE